MSQTMYVQLLCYIAAGDKKLCGCRGTTRRATNTKYRT